MRLKDLKVGVGRRSRRTWCGALKTGVDAHLPVGRGRGPGRDPGGAGQGVGLLLPAGGAYREGGAAGGRARARP
jgi:hypothetical protein